MSSQLIFDEQSMIDGNIFKFEERLHSHLNKYIENGALLTTYFSIKEDATTVDRGTQDIEELFGNRSPIRYNKIENFPVYGFGQLNVENTDELQIEDFNVDGECIIIPSTIVPKQYDCFIINHLKMKALFIVTAVQYDSMKVDGTYKIHYHLQSTSDDTIKNVESHTVETYNTDLNAIGSNINPIIKQDDFILRSKIKSMIIKMIESYKALFYNERHNCFLFHNTNDGLDYFDLCGNEFIAKHNIMNYENSTNVIMLHNKIKDPQMPFFYNNSVYNWIELGAPERLIQKFHYILNYAEGYPYSSFARWGDGDIQIMQPLSLQQVGINVENSFFDETQIKSFMSNDIPDASEYDKLIWKYIHNTNIPINEISLYTADALLSSIRNIDVYLYTPIIIYIIRKILMMN